MGQTATQGSASCKTTRVVRVLEADPELADVLSERELAEARRELLARAVRLAKGDWSPSRTLAAGNGDVGILVTDGILCREVIIGDSVCAELVGPGDLLRPWDNEGGGLFVSSDTRWRVLDEARLALLGRDFASAAARWPAITGALVARAVRRAHALALSATISCTTGVERRLLMLFCHLAERWGRVRPDGIAIPVEMTHEVVARLIGARRPSVSTSLTRLAGEGLILRLDGNGWLLRADPAAPMASRHPIAGAGRRMPANERNDRSRPRLELASARGAGAVRDQRGELNGRPQRPLTHKRPTRVSSRE